MCVEFWEENANNPYDTIQEMSDAVHNKWPSFSIIYSFFYLLVRIPIHLNQMNVIQTDSFEILNLGYNVIMVSKGCGFDTCFGHFFISVYLGSKIDFSLKKSVESSLLKPWPPGKYWCPRKGSKIKIQTYWGKPLEIFYSITTIIHYIC